MEEEVISTLRAIFPVRVKSLTFWSGHGMTVLVLPFFCPPFRWFNERFAVWTCHREYAIVSRDFYEQYLAKHEVR